jgi:hypothetical protein
LIETLVGGPPDHGRAQAASADSAVRVIDFFYQLSEIFDLPERDPVPRL